MKDDDKIFGAFRSAASNGEDHAEFPAMDRVWQRVDEKLDQRELHSGMARWKKLAIAASVLLIFTIGYVFLAKPPIENRVVVTEPVEEPAPKIPLTPVSPDIDSTKIIIIKPSSRAIVSADVVQEISPVPEPMIPQTPEAASTAVQADEFTPPQTEPEIVAGTYNSEVESMSAGQKQVKPAKSSPPLLVVDGKAISGKEYASRKNVTAADEDVQTLVLDEPLYIINGKEYSEEEMFGPNPTSPYAPLNKQEIESVKVLQGKEATDAYGQKGQKGVLIIKTKNGKPASSKKAKSR